MKQALLLKKIFNLFFIILFLTLITPQQIFAANTTINFSPQSGSFEKPFIVNLVIDGKGEKFNAAAATISLPSHIKIQEINLGDCHFSFLTTPTIQNPSFEGVILSSYSQKCTAYSLKVVPVKKGKADLSIDKANVKRYGDAVEILSKKQGASYTITGTTETGKILGEQTNEKKEPYTVNLKISAENKPVSNANVTVNSFEKKKLFQATTDKDGVVKFSNLKEGIYDVVVEQNNKKVGESIINVTGSNSVLALGINLDTQKNNPLLKNANTIFTQITTSPYFMLGAVVVGIVLGICLSFLILKLRERKK